MKKVVILIAMILFSVNAFASDSGLANSIGKSIRKSESESALHPHAIIYGGQDINRQQVATANESLWAGEATQIG